MYEQCSQVLAASFTDTHHHPALAAGMLTRHKSEPSRQVPAVLKIRTIADCRYHRGCGLGANPPNLGDSLADLAGFEDRINLSIESFDASVDFEHEGVHACQDFPHQGRQLIVGRRENLGNEPACPRGRDSDRDPAVKQESAHLADQRGSMIY